MRVTHNGYANVTHEMEAEFMDLNHFIQLLNMWNRSNPDHFTYYTNECLGPTIASYPEHNTLTRRKVYP